jgi:hypothetical protein
MIQRLKITYSMQDCYNICLVVGEFSSFKARLVLCCEMAAAYATLYCRTFHPSRHLHNIDM